MRTFSTGNCSIAALLITLYPRLPTGPNDNRCHLQVFLQRIIDNMSTVEVIKILKLQIARENMTLICYTFFILKILLLYVYRLIRELMMQCILILPENIVLWTFIVNTHNAFQQK